MWSRGDGAYSVMWLAGTPPGDLAHPEGFEVYLDTDTGREVYIGRPFPETPAFPVADDPATDRGNSGLT